MILALGLFINICGMVYMYSQIQEDERSWAWMILSLGCCCGPLAIPIYHFTGKDFKKGALSLIIVIAVLGIYGIADNASGSGGQAGRILSMLQQMQGGSGNPALQNFGSTSSFVPPAPSEKDIPDLPAETLQAPFSPNPLPGILSGVQTAAGGDAWRAYGAALAALQALGPGAVGADPEAFAKHAQCPAVLAAFEAGSRIPVAQAPPLDPRLFATPRQMYEFEKNVCRGVLLTIRTRKVWAQGWMARNDMPKAAAQLQLMLAGSQHLIALAPDTETYLAGLWAAQDSALLARDVLDKMNQQAAGARMTEQVTNMVSLRMNELNNRMEMMAEAEALDFSPEGGSKLVSWKHFRQSLKDVEPAATVFSMESLLSRLPGGLGGRPSIGELPDPFTKPYFETKPDAGAGAHKQDILQIATDAAQSPDHRVRMYGELIKASAAGIP